MKNLAPKLTVTQSIVPHAVTATVYGAGVSMANFDECMFVFSPGVITDGVHTPSLQWSNDNATWTNVTVGTDQIGALNALATDTIQSVGYIGQAAYVRPVVTVTGNPATGGVYEAFAVQGCKRKLP